MAEQPPSGAGKILSHSTLDMATIKLRNSDLEATVDDDQLDKLSKYKWYALRVNSRLVYAITNAHTVDGRHSSLRMHRLVLPNTARVDHIDQNGLNNTRQNLRAATHSQNLANSAGRRNRSGMYKGVSQLPNGRWRAKITHNRANIHIGCYATAEDAALAYNMAASELFGMFAGLNAVERKG